MPRWFPRNDSWDFGGKPDPDEAESREPKGRKRRLAMTFVFTTLFFAGASLAAVAGNRFSASVAEDTPLEATTTMTDGSAQAAPAADASAAAAADGSAAAAPADSAAPAADTSAPAGSADTADSAAGPSDRGFTQVSSGPSATQDSSSGAATTSSSGSAGQSTKRSGSRHNDAQSQWVQLRKVLLPKTKPAPKPEIEGPASAATVWLNSPLPDPTPPALRLSPKFPANLKKAAKAGGADWAVIIRILRPP